MEQHFFGVVWKESDIVSFSRYVFNASLVRANFSLRLKIDEVEWR